MIQGREHGAGSAVYVGPAVPSSSRVSSSVLDGIGDAPIEFPLDGVVPGLSQGIEAMAVGGRRVTGMPRDLAYGSAARPGLPADSTRSSSWTWPASVDL